MEVARLARLKAELADARADIRDKDEELAVLDVEMQRNMRLVEAAPETASTAHRFGKIEVDFWNPHNSERHTSNALEGIANALRKEVHQHGERFGFQLAGLSAGARALASQLAHEHEERVVSMTQMRQDMTEWKEAACCDGVLAKLLNVQGALSTQQVQNQQHALDVKAALRECDRHCEQQQRQLVVVEGAQRIMRDDLGLHRQHLEAQSAEIASMRQGVDALAKEVASTHESAWSRTLGVTENLRETCERLSIEISALGARLDVVASETSGVQEEVRQHRDEMQADFKAWGDIAASRMAELTANIDDARSAWAHEAASLRAALDSCSLPRAASAVALPSPPGSDVDGLRALLDAVQQELQDVARELATERVARYSAIEELSRSMREQCPAHAAGFADEAAGFSTACGGEQRGGGPASLVAAPDRSRRLSAQDLVESVRGMERDVPFLAKAIVAGSQELSVRLQEERSLRRAAEVVHEARIKQLERQLQDLMDRIGQCPKFEIGTPDVEPATCGAGATPKRGAVDDSPEPHGADAAGAGPVGAPPVGCSLALTVDSLHSGSSASDAPISPRCLSAELRQGTASPGGPPAGEELLAADGSGRAGQPQARPPAIEGAPGLPWHAGSARASSPQHAQAEVAGSSRGFIDAVQGLREENISLCESILGLVEGMHDPGGPGEAPGSPP